MRLNEGGPEEERPVSSITRVMAQKVNAPVRHPLRGGMLPGGVQCLRLIIEQIAVTMRKARAGIVRFQIEQVVVIDEIIGAFLLAVE